MERLLDSRMVGRTAGLLLLTGCLWVFGVPCVAQEPPAPASPNQTVKQRIKAARDLSKLDSNSIPELMGMLQDPDSGVRYEAVKAITTIGTQGSLVPLVQATADKDPQVQIRAVDGLVNFYLPGYVKSSLDRLGNFVRGRFVEPNEDVIPPYVTVRPDVIQAISTVIRAGDSLESRAEAARASGILRARAAEPDLMDALHSKDDNLLYESIVALQKIRDEQACHRVIFLLNDLKERVQLAAIDTAAVLQCREAMPELKRAYENGRDAKVRKAAMTAIAMLPDSRNRPLFEEAKADKVDGVRTAAFEGLGRLRDPADTPMIKAAFAEEKKMNPRLAQAFSLVTLGETELTEFSPLQYLVNTLNSRIYRDVAVAYLTELAHDQQVRENIYSKIDRAMRDEKIGLAKVFAASGGPDTLTVLEKLSRDSDAGVAQASLDSLRTLRARL